MPGVQILPTQPPRPELGFDLWQFQSRAKAVSAESQISFADYSHMHAMQRAATRYKGFIPRFAASDEQLRLVLSVAAWKYANGGKVPFQDWATLSVLKEMAETKFKSTQARCLDGLPDAEKRMLERHLVATSHAGGWLQRACAVAWLSWRLGYSSPQIAEQLWMQAPGVRIILYRLTKIARQLGLETFAPRKYQSQGKVRQAHMTKLPPPAKLLKIQKANPYWSAGRLAKRFKVRKTTVQSALRRAKHQKEAA
jgi:hypothetical protein